MASPNRQGNRANRLFQWLLRDLSRTSRRASAHAPKVPTAGWVFRTRRGIFMPLRRAGTVTEAVFRMVPALRYTMRRCRALYRVRDTGSAAFRSDP